MVFNLDDYGGSVEIYCPSKEHSAALMQYLNLIGGFRWKNGRALFDACVPELANKVRYKIDNGTISWSVGSWHTDNMLHAADFEWPSVSFDEWFGTREALYIIEHFKEMTAVLYDKLNKWEPGNEGVVYAVVYYNIDTFAYDDIAMITTSIDKVVNHPFLEDATILVAEDAGEIISKFQNVDAKTIRDDITNFVHGHFRDKTIMFNAARSRKVDASVIDNFHVQVMCENRNEMIRVLSYFERLGIMTKQSKWHPYRDNYGVCVVDGKSKTMMPCSITRLDDTVGYYDDVFLCLYNQYDWE